MFLHGKKLQYPVRVDGPNPVLAKNIQELLGGKWGEMTVMHQYLFQAWGVHGDLDDKRIARVKDLLLDTGTEEIAHVEMLATCVGLLLEGCSPEEQEEATKGNGAGKGSLITAANPQHIIATAGGAAPQDAMGNPWNGSYINASGNLVADLYADANAEMFGRLAACRVYESTTDSGVRDMLSFMIARDHMHQIQWLAAIEELGGLTETLPVPADFPLEKEQQKHAYEFMGYSLPGESTAGEERWAKGPSIDGHGEFTYLAEPFVAGQEPHLAAPARTQHNALPAAGNGRPHTSTVDQVKELVTGPSKSE
jgi:Mn-containing catalase